ncbi:MAG TPA: hypothetical protein VHX19_17885 [Stellaceae bacterium]|nr:hypothetical protein [Stellaceae bacterium]
MADTSLHAGSPRLYRNAARAGWAEFLGRHSQALVLLALAAIVAVLLVAPMTTIHSHLLNNYSEGWNAYLAKLAAAGSALYPDRLALTTNNYPPLSFYIVGHLGAWLGDDIFAGRLVALLSVLAVTANVFLVLRLLRASRISAGFGALLFLAYTLSVYFAHIIIDDPIWLAEALASTGLVIFLKSRGGKHAISGALLALVAIVAGLLVKHSVLALPVALFLWCLCYDRKAFVAWLVGGTVLTAAVIAAFDAIYGANFFIDVLMHQRVYSIRHLVMNIQILVVPYLPLMMGAVALWLLDGRHPMVRLIALYVIFAAFIGIFFLGGVGVVDGVLFDLTIALAIGCGLLIDRLQQAYGRRKPAWAAAAMLMAASPVMAALPLSLFQMNDAMSQAAAKNAAVNADVAFIAGTNGPAACQTLALCYWAGKPETLDFYNTNQKIAKGLLGEEAIATLIEKRYFAVVELDTAPPPEQSLPEAAIESLHALYRVAHTDGGLRFYVPK